MGTSIELFIPGVPQPGGSKRTFVARRRDGTIVTDRGGRPIVNVVEDCEKSGPWRDRVSYYALKFRPMAMLDGPLKLEVVFTMPRLGSHYGTGRNAGVLKASAPSEHTTKPDVTKLLRSLEDSLTGIIWVDDARISRQGACKIYGDKPGAWVRVTVLEHETPVRGATRPEEMVGTLFEGSVAG